MQQLLAVQLSGLREMVFTEMEPKGPSSCLEEAEDKLES